MPNLHPQIVQVLDAMAKAELRLIEEMTPTEARAQMEATARARQAEPLTVAKVEERLISGAAGEIRLRLYWPDAAGPVPAIVYYHGGGHVIGSLDTHDFVARNLCAGAGALVASIDYRMGPEHKFPAAVDDCFAALQWVAANAVSFGGDASRLAIAGDSAGGNLAAVCAILARDHGGPELKRQILVYPATAPDCESESHHLFGVGHLLSRRMVLWFFGMHSGGQDHTKDFRYAPLITPDLSGLAPALVIVAGFDPLRDEGIAYANRLQEAGNPVDLLAFDGMVHGFFSLSGYIDAGKIAIGEVVKSLRAGFGLVT
jgi:acetyl esterase